MPGRYGAPPETTDDLPGDRPAGTQSGRAVERYWKVMWSMVMVELPPYQKPIAS
jgi:hypothetical protein